MTFKKFTLLTAATVCCSTAAQAVTLNYTFDPGTVFDFGGGNTYQAVGSFTFDTDLMQVTTFAYSGVQTGTGPVGPFIFTSVVTDSPTQITFSGDCCGDVDRFIFANSLATGGTIPIIGFQYAFGSGSFTSYPIQGSVTALNGAVPEPATWALIILGFGAVGATLRRRSGAVRVSRARLNFA